VLDDRLGAEERFGLVFHQDQPPDGDRLALPIVLGAFFDIQEEARNPKPKLETSPKHE
jgi:hypothetical protein